MKTGNPKKLTWFNEYVTVDCIEHRRNYGLIPILSGDNDCTKCKGDHTCPLNDFI